MPGLLLPKIPQETRTGCYTCEKEFRNIEILQNHVKHEHNHWDNKLRCQPCGRMFRIGDHLFRHILQHHPIANPERIQFQYLHRNQTYYFHLPSG